MFAECGGLLVKLILKKNLTLFHSNAFSENLELKRKLFTLFLQVLFYPTLTSRCNTGAAITFPRWSCGASHPLNPYCEQVHLR